MSVDFIKLVENFSINLCSNGYFISCNDRHLLIVNLLFTEKINIV